MFLNSNHKITQLHKFEDSESSRYVQPTFLFVIPPIDHSVWSDSYEMNLRNSIGGDLRLDPSMCHGSKHYLVIGLPL